MRTSRRSRKPVPERLNDLSHEVLGAAFRVHSTLGPGLLERVYHAALLIELQERGIEVESEVESPLFYEGHRLPGGLRIDLIVEDELILEINAVDGLTRTHTAQLLTYLKATGCRLGLLLNFNNRHLRNGIKRVIR